MPTPGGPSTASTPAEAAAESSMRLSPEPGVYDPVLPIAVWNGAATPALPVGGGPDTAPGDIVTTVQRSTGVDVSNVRIRRDTGPSVQRAEAKAMTHEGEVHLPAERGELGTTENRSLLAHELVHVAQQRTMGSSRPLEATPGGQRLELQAQAMEHATLHNTPAPDLPLHAPPTPVVQRASFTDPAPAASPFTPEQVTTLLGLASSQGSNGPTVQRDAPDATPAASTPAPAEAAPAASLAAAPEQDWDLVAAKVFPKIRSKLKSELRSDRERQGKLTDLHR
jgi:hypothetical protein